MVLALGIDPGTKVTGYGLVHQEGPAIRLVAAGTLTARAADVLPLRLFQVFQGLREIISAHRPDLLAVEDIFYAKNVRSAIRLGHVRGVVLLAAAEAGLPVYEYPPAAIKMTVAGYGRADKRQVGLMVGQLLKLEAELAEDASDALAAAICHLHQTPALLQGARP